MLREITYNHEHNPFAHWPFTDRCSPMGPTLTTGTDRHIALYLNNEAKELLDPGLYTAVSPKGKRGCPFAATLIPYVVTTNPTSRVMNPISPRPRLSRGWVTNTLWNGWLKSHGCHKNGSNTSPNRLCFKEGPREAWHLTPEGMVDLLFWYHDARRNSCGNTYMLDIFKP